MADSKITKSTLNIGSISEVLKRSQSDFSVISSKNTFDLAALCAHTNINMWAKYKPVQGDASHRFVTLTYNDSTGEWEDITGDTSGSQRWWEGRLTGVDVYVMPKVSASASVSNYTTEFKSIIAQLRDTTKCWTYNSKSDPWFRLSDFLGYLHTARCPLVPSMPSQATLHQGDFVNFDLSPLTTSMRQSGEICFADLSRYTNDIGNVSDYSFYAGILLRLVDPTASTEEYTQSITGGYNAVAAYVKPVPLTDDNGQSSADSLEASSQFQLTVTDDDISLDTNSTGNAGNGGFGLSLQSWFDNEDRAVAVEAYLFLVRTDRSNSTIAGKSYDRDGFVDLCSNGNVFFAKLTSGAVTYKKFTVEPRVKVLTEISFSLSNAAIKTQNGSTTSYYIDGGGLWYFRCSDYITGLVGDIVFQKQGSGSPYPASSYRIVVLITVTSKDGTKTGTFRLLMRDYTSVTTFLDASLPQEFGTSYFQFRSYAAYADIAPDQEYTTKYGLPLITHIVDAMSEAQTEYEVDTSKTTYQFIVERAVSDAYEYVVKGDSSTTVNFSGSSSGGGSQSSLSVDLQDQWQASSVAISGYTVYESFSNYNVASGLATIKLTIVNKPDFKLYINSYAESSYDYTIAWELDTEPASSPSYTSTGVKATTRANQQDPSGGISAFTEVDYSNDGGTHTIYITYRKDSTQDANNDKGYIAIPN